IRTGGVVCQANGRREDLGSHARRRRLAVRRRDEGRATLESRGEPIDRRRVELPEELPRNRRAAARTREARQASGDPCGGDLRAERKETHVGGRLSQPFRTTSGVPRQRGLTRSGEPNGGSPKGGCPPRRPHLASVVRRTGGAVCLAATLFSPAATRKPR